MGDVASGARSVGRPQVAVVRPPIEAEDGRCVSFTDDGSALIHHLTQNAERAECGGEIGANPNN